MLPCYCIAWLSHALPWKLGATSLLVAVLRLGGLGHSNFFQVCHFRDLYRRDAASRSLRCSKAYTGTSQCGPHPGGLVVRHWFRPSVDGPSWTQWGSMPVLVRDLAP